MKTLTKLAVLFSTINIVSFAIFELATSFSFIAQNLLLGYELSLVADVVLMVFVGMFVGQGPDTVDKSKRHPKRAKGFFATCILYLLSGVPVGIALALAPYSLAQIGIWTWELSAGFSALVDLSVVLAWAFEGY